MTIYMRRLDDIDAFWSKEWSNANESVGHRGCIRFTGDDVQLAMPFYQTTGLLTQVKTKEGYEYLASPFLYGRAEDGRYIVVVGASSTRSPWWIRGSALLIAESAFEPVRPVESVRIKMIGLDQWLKTDDAENVKAQQDERTTLFMDGLVRITSESAEETEQPEHSIASIVIEPKGEMGFCDVIDVASRLSSFVGFCCGFDAKITNMTINFMDNPTSVQCYVPFVTGREPRDYQLDFIPLTRERLDGYVEAGVRAWLTSEGELVTPRAMLGALVSERWSLPLDLRFLTAAQVLEVLAKESLASTEVDVESSSEDNYEEMQKKTLNAIPNKALRTWANDHLKKKHARTGPNQEQRLRRLLERYERTVKELGISDVGAFITHHVDSRNYYTHRTKPGDGTLYGSALNRHYEVVLLLCQYVMADLSGIPEGVVARSYQESGYGKEARERYAAMEAAARQDRNPEERDAKSQGVEEDY